MYYAPSLLREEPNDSRKEKKPHSTPPSLPIFLTNPSAKVHYTGNRSPCSSQKHANTFSPVNWTNCNQGKRHFGTEGYSQEEIRCHVSHTASYQRAVSKQPRSRSEGGQQYSSLLQYSIYKVSTLDFRRKESLNTTISEFANLTLSKALSFPVQNGDENKTWFSQHQKGYSSL